MEALAASARLRNSDCKELNSWNALVLISFSELIFHHAISSARKVGSVAFHMPIHITRPKLLSLKYLKILVDTNLKKLTTHGRVASKPIRQIAGDNTDRGRTSHVDVSTRCCHLADARVSGDRSNRRVDAFLALRLDEVDRERLSRTPEIGGERSSTFPDATWTIKPAPATSTGSQQVESSCSRPYESILIMRKCLVEIETVNKNRMIMFNVAGWLAMNEYDLIGPGLVPVFEVVIKNLGTTQVEGLSGRKRGIVSIIIGQSVFVERNMAHRDRIWASLRVVTRTRVAETHLRLFILLQIRHLQFSFFRMPRHIRKPNERCMKRFLHVYTEVHVKCPLPFRIACTNWRYDERLFTLLYFTSMYLLKRS
ncbi:hypothetical protein ALC56_02020 [Trachymyrmex septentrionalis]|uniref:Uncharacterized protein n=1 Tax=Trachymyrmex septentrionalis TaxID=34720 RepID=A0A195FTZ0_9HYME|nr:hypothetical protein ALC56_02020 [Trachymyrmex septentrionalis]